MIPRKTNYLYQICKISKKDSESLSYSPSKMWKLIPESIKSISLLLVFKIAAKQRKPDDCQCRLYRTYIPQIAFV